MHALRCKNLPEGSGQDNLRDEVVHWVCVALIWRNKTGRKERAMLLDRGGGRREEQRHGRKLSGAVLPGVLLLQTAVP